MSHGKRCASVVFALAALTFGQALITSAASAATITVTTTADDTSVDGQVSLREAIESVNGGANFNGDVNASGVYGTSDTIVVPANAAHYAVSGGELMIIKPVLIQGGGASGTTIDAAGTSRIFHVTNGTGATGTVTFQGLTITGGSTTSNPGGGAVLADSGSGFLQFMDDAVTGNSANLTAASSCCLGGGAVDTDGNTMTVTGGTFSNNTATISVTGSCCRGGGAIYNDGANLVINGTTFAGNAVTITGNGTGGGDEGGGAIHQDSGGVFVRNSTFTSNTTAVTAITGCCSGAGAIYNDGNSNTTGISLIGSTLSGNTASLGTSGTPLGSCCHGGGAIYNDSHDLALSGTSVTGNTLTLFAVSCCEGGGGIYQDADNSIVQNSAITNNTANVNFTSSCCSGGGGFYNDASSRSLASFTSSVLSGNTLNLSGAATSDNGGGGIYNDGNNLAFTSSTIGNNTATIDGTGSELGGGGIYDDGNGTTLTGATLSGNAANFTGTPSGSAGGGGTFTFEPFNYSNSTITGNSTNVPVGTDQGGGAIWTDDGGTLSNVTLAGNSSSVAPGGGVFNDNSELQSMNTIIAENTAGSGGANCDGDTPTFTSNGYNLEDSANTCHFAGIGDIVAGGTAVGLAALADNGGPTMTRRLLAGSPAINAGDPAGCSDLFGALLTDQRGIARVGRCDIGAYEFAPPVNTAAPAISGILLAGQSVACSNGSWSGSPISGFTDQWNRDGTAIGGATGATYTISTADPGHALTCTVTATNADGSASATSAPVTPPVIPPSVPGQPLQLFLIATPVPSATGVRLNVLCVGGTIGQNCKVVVRLTAKEKLKGRKIVGVAARTKKVVVGSATVNVVTGKTRRVSVRLNKTGKKLLKQFGKLPVSAAIRLVGTNGKTLSTINTKFTIRKKRARH
jgi:CSLREA domain-containing protein